MNLATVQARAVATARDAWDAYRALSKPRQWALAVAGVLAAAGGIVFLIFHDAFFKLLVEFSHKWKETPGGGAILFGLIILISFPPLIGYSALSSMVGMIYGFPLGWPFLAAATLVGSTLSFIVSRYVLSGYAHRLASSNVKFAALTKTMETDTFRLLWMIRLCPLPYSLSNGALASIPSVSIWRFFLATAATSPKLLMHIFIGDRLARIGTEKDTFTKILDILSISVAVGVGSLTAYIIYNRTMDRANLMEAQDGYADLESGALDEFEMPSDNDEL